MALKVSIRTTFEEFRAIEPFYTGGEITGNSAGTYFDSTVDDDDCFIFNSITARPLCRKYGDC